MEMIRISPDLLMSLNKSGRNILYYISKEALANPLDTRIADSGTIFITIELNPLKVMTYLEPKIGKQATSYNVQRGINNLKQNGVLIELIRGTVFRINPKLVSHE